MRERSHFNRFGALLTAVMLTGLVIVLGGAVHRFVPQWQLVYLAVACLLVALETAFVSFTVRYQRMWANESVRYMVAEVAVLAALMRIVATLSLGVASLQADAQRWLLYPLSAVADGPFLGCFVVGLLVALAAHRSTRDLIDLAPQEFEGRVAPSDEYLRVHTLANYDRADALRRINRRFILGGVLLLIGLGLQAVNLNRIVGTALPIGPVVATAALAYVISGFLLYSQARLMLLQSRWNLEQAAVEPGVIRRWTRSSVLLIGGLALLMLALPRTYGMGLLDTFRTTVGFVGGLVVQIGYIMLWLISLLTIIPLLLFSWLMPGPDAVPPPLPPPAPVPPPPPAEASGAPPLLPSLVFWACMVFLVGYACWIVLQRHPGLLDIARLRGPLAALRRWLWGTWHDAPSWAQQVAQAAAKRLARPPRAARAGWASLRPGRLAPRELVRYFYLSTIQRAAKHGVGRKVGQTPYEYSTVLTRTLPDSHNDVVQLTDAFVAARYGPHPPDTNEVRRVRHHWERLRRRLSRAKERDHRVSADETQ